MDLSQYDKDTVIEAHKEAIRKLYRSSLYLVCKGLLGYKDVNKHTHGGTIAALESDTQRKLIVLPRGSLKSSICDVAYPIWRLLRNYNERILIDSELFGNSSTFLREIKHHLENPDVTSIFGNFKTQDNWNQDSITIKQRSFPYKESSITCGGVGTTKVGQHYTIIIGDDYNSPKNSGTPEGIEKVIRHYKYNMSILEPNGTYVIVGTRYSSRDIPGFILEDELGLKEHEQITGNYDTERVTDGLF